jgi:hypothetical protein
VTVIPTTRSVLTLRQRIGWRIARMRTQILEREHELRLLAQAVGEAATRDVSVVTVQGEAGIGKSSVLVALRDRLAESSRMLVGRCDDPALPRILGLPGPGRHGRP